MAGPLAADLKKRLERLSRSDADTRLNLIVTLEPGVRAASFEAPGLSVDQRVPDPPLVMGTATPAQALALARARGVALIEVDEGGMHAIDSER
jgi:hypothetical protein